MPAARRAPIGASGSSVPRGIVMARVSPIKTSRTIRDAAFDPRAASAVAIQPATTQDTIKPITSPSVSLPPFGYDLADNIAGAAARTKREEVNGKAPVWNLVARAFGVKTEERNWRVGAKGEEKVGHELNKLRNGWHVLHAIPVGEHDSDIDHVVIGPRGVFTLNTKHLPDASVCVHERSLRVNKYATSYLDASRHEAQRAARLLTSACAMQVDVQALLVFVDAFVTHNGKPPDVGVTTLRALRMFLMQQPERLTPAQVEHIFTVARNSLTWQPA